jgi:hypothetical protein
MIRYPKGVVMKVITRAYREQEAGSLLCEFAGKEGCGKRSVSMSTYMVVTISRS